MWLEAAKWKKNALQWLHCNLDMTEFAFNENVLTGLIHFRTHPEDSCVIPNNFTVKLGTCELKLSSLFDNYQTDARAKKKIDAVPEENCIKTAPAPALALRPYSQNSATDTGTMSRLYHLYKDAQKYKQTNGSFWVCIHENNLYKRASILLIRYSIVLYIKGSQ